MIQGLSLPNYLTLTTANGGKPFRLADKVDYLAPHFYPATLTPADLNGDICTQDRGRETIS